MNLYNLNNLRQLNIDYDSVSANIDAAYENTNALVERWKTLFEEDNAKTE